jgi:hypothetical protein
VLMWSCQAAASSRKYPHLMLLCSACWVSGVRPLTWVRGAEFPRLSSPPASWHFIPVSSWGNSPPGESHTALCPDSGLCQVGVGCLGAPSQVHKQVLALAGASKCQHLGSAMPPSGHLLVLLWPGLRGLFLNSSPASAGGK